MAANCDGNSLHFLQPGLLCQNFSALVPRVLGIYFFSKILWAAKRHSHLLKQCASLAALLGALQLLALQALFKMNFKFKFVRGWVVN